MVAAIYDAAQNVCCDVMTFASEWKSRPKIACVEKDLGWDWTLYDMLEEVRYNDVDEVDEPEEDLTELHAFFSPDSTPPTPPTHPKTLTFSLPVAVTVAPTAPGPVTPTMVREFRKKHNSQNMRNVRLRAGLQGEIRRREQRALAAIWRVLSELPRQIIVSHLPPKDQKTVRDFYETRALRRNIWRLSKETHNHIATFLAPDPEKEPWRRADALPMQFKARVRARPTFDSGFEQLLPPEQTVITISMPITLENAMFHQSHRKPYMGADVTVDATRTCYESTAHVPGTFNFGPQPWRRCRKKVAKHPLYKKIPKNTDIRCHWTARVPDGVTIDKSRSIKVDHHNSFRY